MNTAITIGTKVRLNGYGFDCFVAKLYEVADIPCAVIVSASRRKYTSARVADLTVVS